jgi:hypothetical protein
LQLNKDTNTWEEANITGSVYELSEPKPGFFERQVNRVSGLFGLAFNGLEAFTGGAVIAGTDGLATIPGWALVADATDKGAANAMRLITGEVHHSLLYRGVRKLTKSDTAAFLVDSAAPAMIMGIATKVSAPQAMRASATRDLGPARAPARPLLENEGVLINESQGLQSRTSGRFKNVQLGTHGEADTKYLWTIDSRGVNVALEKTAFPTPRGNIVHTNLSSEASIGGEAWFGPNNTVTINAGSGRFGDAAGITAVQWNAAVRYWESLGYKVNPIPFGKR